MFHLPLKLRNQTEYCTPKGPSFKRAPLVKFAVNGTHVQLSAPRHHTSLPIEPHNASKHYDLERLHLDYCFRDKPEWRGLPILFRIWEFYGPWFTGCRALAYTSLILLTPREVKESSSFFHPRAFESALADYLAYNHGAERKTNCEQALLAPINWNPITRLPCIAVTFDVVENCQESFRKGEIYRYLCVPITDHHILCLSFHLTRTGYFPEKNEPYKDVDEWVNVAPMKTLADDVINSLQITLSPEAQAQQAKALSGLKDATLIKEFPPLKWT